MIIWIAWGSWRLCEKLRLLKLFQTGLVAGILRRGGSNSESEVRTSSQDTDLTLHHHWCSLTWRSANPLVFAQHNRCSPHLRGKFDGNAVENGTDMPTCRYRTVFSSKSRDRNSDSVNDAIDGMASIYSKTLLPLSLCCGLFFCVCNCVLSLLKRFNTSAIWFSIIVKISIAWFYNSNL